MAGEGFKYAMESAYKDVERDALARTTAQIPKAILLGGQPGSGKSALSTGAVRELRTNGGAVVIDADRMREENPRYKQLSREDPLHAADRTQKEAGEWANRLTMAAMENRRNLVVDGTMRSPEKIRDLTTRLKEHGYEVEVRVLAVNPETSMTRARLRFEEQVAERGTGRFVNKEQHDNAYTGMVESVRALERDKLIDSVRIYDANHRQIYENSQERGEWKKKAAAVEVLEQERGRPWTHAERRDYVSALDNINTLAKQREGIRDNVTYAVGTLASNSAKEYSNVNDAARAFREAKAEDQPYVIRTEHLPNGRESASTPGQTTYTENDGVREYGKFIGGDDESLKRAYADAQRPEHERAARPVLADRDELAAKLDAARTDLARFEQTPTYQRAQAFDQLTKREALERHPELDGTYKQLHDIRQGWTPQTTQDQQDISHFNTRTELSELLHRGRIPEGNVTLDESRRVIDMAASHQGLVLRDAQELKQDVKGEVVATSSHHALVKMSDMVAVRYEKEGLDRDVRVGEKVVIQHGNEKSQVYEQGKEPARENARDVGRDMDR
ncbi:toxin [Verminephrobacter aporrectodeae subsp. tuberculatae]|uniref:Toxin n=2 Tax=Verminephrobacter TaxID=364316 RepID=A0ABT3KZ84_9BURK|nr:toxin [Verminephrobacter aporrectodeae subsp. tuberculatae]